jgi:tetratricopeptide (TPR) repeat protein
MLEVLAARARVALGMPSGLTAPTSPSPALSLAMGELCLQQRDTGRAVSFLSDAARDPALSADAHRLLAEANEHNPAEALRCLERAGASGAIVAERAAILLDLGDAAGARAAAMEALAMLADGADLRASALAMITLADAQQEDAIAAEGTLTSARLLARRAGDLALIARIDALDAAQCLSRGELATARTLVAGIEGPLGDALRAHVDALSACRPTEPPMHPSAARLVRRARGSCAIARDGSRAILPSGPVVLEKRPILQRLLRAFVERRVEAPGVPLTVGDLFTAGWPGERVPTGTQGDRVHASLQALRDLGLRSYIVTLAGGWALDPDRAFDLVSS